MSTRLRLSVIAWALLAATVPGGRVWGTPPKGAVTLGWHTVDNVKGDLSLLNGRIVVVIFFAPGDEKLTDLLAAVRNCEGNLGYKGVSFVGVFKGNQSAELKSILADARVSFPVHFDEKKGADPAFRAWKVEKTTNLFILDPDRNIVAENVPAEKLEATLQAQLQKTPPRLFDEKRMAEAVAQVDFSEAMLKLGRARGAARSLALVAEDLKQSEALSEKFVPVSRDLEAAAGKLVDETETMFEQKKTTEAIVLLEQLKKAMKGSALEARIDDQYNSFLDDPDIKASVAKERKAVEAADMLEAVGDHEVAKDLIGANALANKLTKTYPGTAAATEAKARIAKWEADPKVKRKLRDAEYGERGESLLKAADAYKASGMTTKAREAYERIAKDFEGSTAADKAVAALKGLK